MLGDLNPGLPELNTQLLLSDQKLLMSRQTSDSGVELWTYDGSSVQQLTDINPGEGSSNPRSLAIHQGDLYFIAYDGIATSLWRIRDIATNPSLPIQLTNVSSETTLFDYGQTLVSTPDALYFVGAQLTGTLKLFKVQDGVASVLKEFQPGGVFGAATRLSAVGTTLYFVAVDSAAGSELWKSDGTAAGTLRISDIRPGSAGSNPNYLTNVSGSLYFRCSPTAGQYELWRLGANEVPERVLAAPGNPLPTNPVALTNANGKLVFTGTSAAGQELWALNTDQQSYLVQDLAAGATGSQPYGYVPVDGVVYFSVRNNNFSRKLWRTNLTASGTVNLPPTATFVRQMTAVDGALYFTTGNSLWRTAPGSNDAFKIFDLPNNGTLFSMQAFGGRAFFTDRGAGGTLWSSDGTTEGTLPVETDSFTGDANIASMVNLNGTLLVSHDSQGRKGISTVAPDLLGPYLRFASSDGGPLNQLTNINGTLYFFSQAKLMKYTNDGQFVEVASLSTTNVSLHSLTEVNGTIYFVDSLNRNLLKTDGTSAGTMVVRQFASGSDLSALINVNGTLYFAANDGTNGTELWKSNGSQADTVMIKNINPGSAGSMPRHLTNFAGTLMFQASNGSSGYELWQSDGTSTGTVMLKDINVGQASSFPESFTLVGTQLYFRATGSDGRELWKSDGTSAGTLQVKDIHPSAGSDPGFLTNVNGILYFVANDGSEGSELWRSDGTASETRMVKSIVPGAGSPSITRMTNFNGTLYFTPDIRPFGQRLWKSDGTESGTQMATTNTQSMSPQVTYNLAVVGEKLYFGGRTSRFGSELFALTDVDYGDADTNFTLAADRGAAHFATGPMLGTSRDSHEGDGVRSVAADADDVNGTDDEDGLLEPIIGSAGGMVNVSLFVSQASPNSTVSVFFDFNQDGKFSEFPDEQVADRLLVSAGINNLSFPVPLDARPGTAAVRIRISDQGSGNPYGLDRNGEVEDHLFTINGDKLLTLPTTGPNDIIVRKANDNLVVLDRSTGLSIFGWPLAETSGLQVIGASNHANKIQIDYEAGGFFELTNGIELVGGSVIDSLTITGAGSAAGRYDLASSNRPRVAYTQDSATNQVVHTGFETILFEGLQSFVTTSPLAVGSTSLTIAASQPVQLADNVTLAGGSLTSTAFSLASDKTLSGFGTLKGNFSGQANSSVIAQGKLTIGNGSSSDGFTTLGALQTNGNTLEILDADHAQLGTLTSLGDSNTPGTLRVLQGLELLAGNEITGYGTIDTLLASAAAVLNAGRINGRDLSHRLKLPGFVTGDGQLNFVETTGTLSPGTTTVLGTYSNLLLSGDLAMELGGTQLGGTYDSITDSGSLVLSGGLKVSLINGHVPSAGMRYRLIEAPTSLSGRFSSVDLPLLPSDVGWELIYGTTTVELQTLALSMSVDLAVISEKSGTALGTVTRNSEDLSQNLVITLASSDTSEVVVPATVTIPAGQESATFTITAVDDQLLDGSITTTITATSPGYSSSSSTIVIEDYETLNLTVSARSMPERGGSIIGTVTRSNTDTASEIVVNILSSDTSEATVPVTVKISAGQASADFAIQAVDDELLDGTQTALIQVSSDGYVGSDQAVDILDSENLTLTTIAPSINEFDGQTTGRITRSNTDIAASLTVQLTSNDPSEVSFPSTVTIPAGQAEVTFAITAVDDTLLDGTQAVTLTAAATGYESANANLNVTDVETLTLIIEASSISELSGQTTGRITRSNTDIAAPLTVQLTSNDPSEVSFPSTVTIPAGQAEVTFAITAVDDRLLDGTQAVTLTAAATGYESANASLSVTDVETLTLVIEASSISELSGQTTGRITRSNTDIAAPLTVQLTSNDPSEVSFPSTVTIPAGQAEVTFAITAVDDRLLDGTQAVTLTAAATGYESATASLSVTDVETLTLVIEASSISELSGQTTGRITRSNTDIAAPLTVQLTSNDPSEVSFPSTVTIPAGQAEVTFAITAVDDRLLDGTQAVTLTAAATGYESANASLSITDVETLTLVIEASSISELSGQTTGRITRSNTDIAAPLTVQLTSNDPSEVSFPSTVTIPAGQAEVTFAITAVDDRLLDGTQAVTLTAAATGYESATASLSVTDVETLTLVIEASSISELSGQTTGRITRSNTDIAAPLTVQLTSNDPSEVSFPSTVTIPAGQAEVTFAITAVDDTLLDGTQAVTLTAAATGYESAIANLSVTDMETLTLVIEASSTSELSGQTTGRVTRSNTDIAAPLTVQLTSNDPSEVSFPSTVTIPAGQAEVTFAITAVDDRLLDGTQAVTLTAAATGYESATANLNVTDVETLTLVIEASSISELSGQTTGRITRSNTDIAAPLTVQLTSNDPSEVSFPSTVTIPAGLAEVTFAITAVDDRLLDGTQAVTITAAATGYESAIANLSVTDMETLTLVIEASSINERRGETTGRITRNNTDISSPLTVQINVNDLSEITFPGTVTIPAGQASTAFSINALDDILIDGPQTVQITVSASGYQPSSAFELTIIDDDRLHPWQNPDDALDVNDDEQVTALDALLVINAINIGQVLTPQLPDPFIPVAYVDVNGDDFLSAIDVLLVINRLNQISGSEGEGIQASSAPAPKAIDYWYEDLDSRDRRAWARDWHHSLEELIDILGRDKRLQLLHPRRR